MGLDPDSARELLTAQRLDLSPDVLAERVAESAGNPLALLELPSLSEDTVPVEPLRIGWRLERTFGRRIAGLPSPTRQAMLLVAAAGAFSEDALSPALDLQGLSIADLEPAETAGLLVSRHGNVGFRHPLIRSALYQSASAPERRAVHRTLAAVFGALSAPQALERQAWHLAAGTLGPDEDAAVILEAAAESAAARRSYSTAMLALLIADPPVAYTEISGRLGIAVGSIGPNRHRYLDKLRRDPVIAGLLIAEAANGK